MCYKYSGIKVRNHGRRDMKWQKSNPKVTGLIFDHIPKWRCAAILHLADMNILHLSIFRILPLYLKHGENINREKRYQKVLSKKYTYFLLWL